MSGLDIPAIKHGLALNLRAALGDGVKVYEEVKNTLIYPCIVIPVPQTIDYSKTFNRGLDTARFDLLCLTGTMSPVSQKNLERLMSGTGEWSIVEIISADRKLGGTCASSKITEMTTGTFQVTMNGEAVIGAEIQLEVVA